MLAIQSFQSQVVRVGVRHLSQKASDSPRLFNDRDLQIAATPKLFAPMGLKDRFGYVPKEQLDQDSLKRSATHCYTTAGVIHRLAGDLLFKRPTPILLNSERAPRIS
jgi:hypothetical protein